MNEQNAKLQALAWNYWPIALIGSVWVWLFGPMMSGQTVAGFRDSAYLYYPLFQWIDAQWAAGELPLWNPYCNFGVPVVADGTSSVFYPGKLVFWCRFLSYPSRYGIYLAMHIPIAAAGTYWLARILKANQAGATLAAFSFAFGGSVLFQVNNVVYLISAAWLPLALVCVWLMVKTGQAKWAVGAGIVCALMILGGDPQMVYHVGLIATGTILAEFLRRRRRRQRVPDRSQLGAYRWAFGSLLQLGLVVAVTTLLAMVQVLPTYQWSKLSERSHSDSAVNLYSAYQELIGWEDSVEEQMARWVPGQNRLYGESPKLFSYLPLDGSFRQNLASVRTDLLAAPAAGSPTDHVYQFSQPPWTLSELWWPNVSGKLFPSYRRWVDTFPGADRVWVPSLYAGVLTIWLAMGGFRLWGRRRRNVWLSRIGLFFCVASFGWFGAIWLWNELVPASWHATQLGPQVGGVYWAMVMSLPKYFAFRYPAKLFVIASLCISLLAGVQLRSHRRLLTGKLTTVFVALTALALAVVALRLTGGWLQNVAPDVLFGPLDAAGCRFDLMLAFGQALVVLGLAMLAVRYLPTRIRSWHGVLCGLVLITAGDITIANRWMLAEVPALVFSGSSPRLDDLKTQLQQHEQVGPPTVYRSRNFAFDPDWQRQGSDRRLDEVVTWQRETLFPKHHLESGIRLVGSFSSIWPMAYEDLLSSLEALEIQPEEYRGLKVPGQTEADPGWVFSVDAIATCRVAVQPEIPAGYVYLWNAEAPDFVRLAEPFESMVDSNLFRAANHDAFQSSARLNIEEISNQRLQFSVDTAERQFLLCHFWNDGNWIAQIRNLDSDESNCQTLVEFSEFCHGVIIEPGSYSIAFLYRPTPFWIGAWVSGISWLVLCLACVYFVGRDKAR